MPVQRNHNLARIDQHSVAPCSFVAVCGLLAGVAANKGNVRGPLVAVKRLRQKSAQSKVPLSSYNRQCRKKCQENIKKRKVCTPQRNATLFYQSTKTKIVLLLRNNGQSESSFVPSFIYCYMTKPFVKVSEEYPDKWRFGLTKFSCDIYKLIPSFGESHYMSFAFWKNDLYISYFLCLCFTRPSVMEVSP